MKAKKQVKKKFFPVEIPILKKEVELYGVEISDLNNRRIKLDLTHELKGRAMEIKLHVNVEKNNAVAIPLETKFPQSYIKRMVRKGTDYSEDSFIVSCKDHKVKVKPLMITRKRVTKSVLSGLRKSAKTEIEKYFSKKTFEELIKENISGEIQKSIMPELKKVYPLSLFELRYLGIFDKEEYDESKELLNKQEEKDGN